MDEGVEIESVSVLAATECSLIMIIRHRVIMKR
jgi:hypothetical protein